MTNPLLSPSASMSSGVAQTGQSVPVMDAAVAQLLALPISDGSLVPSLPADTTQARADARLWTTQYRPLATGALQGVVDFGTTFDSFYAGLVPLADGIVNGDAGAIHQFNQLLQQLQAATAAEADSVQGVAGQLGGYAQLLDRDLAAINADQNTLLTIQSTQAGLAATYQQQADAVEDEIDKMHAQVAWQYLTGHPVSAAFTSMINQLSGRAAALRNLQQEASSAAYTAGQQAQAAGTEAYTVRQYQSALGALQGGVSQLVNGWAAMNGNFAVLEQAEKIHSYGAWTPALLNAAKLDWDTLAAQAQGMLNALGGS